VRIVPWRRLAHSALDRLALGGSTRLIVSADAEFAGGVVRYRVPAGESRTIYLEWLNAPSDARYVHADAATYATALRTVESFWQSKLDAGATISVPEPAVQDAMRGILTQLIAYGWRYSIGNPYEELSYAESLDAAEVAAEYGYPSVARSIVELSLQRMRVRPWRFTAFRGAHILATAATYYRLTHDHSFLRAQTPALAALVDRIAARQRPSGPARGRLLPEPLSTDLEGRDVDSVSGQIEAVTGLRAIAAAWRSTGYPRQAARRRHARRRARPSAAAGRDARLDAPPRRLALRPRPADGQAAPVPAADDDARGLVLEPRDAVRVRVGLVRAELVARDRALPAGARRAAARRAAHVCPHGLTATSPGPGWHRLYGLSASRFLAANDEPDQLVLSLYGMRAAGMTGRHVHLGRGGLGAAGARCVRACHVHAAEHGRERVVPRHAARAARARAQRRPRPSPSRRRARGSPTAARSR